MASDFVAQTYPAAPSQFAYAGRVLFGQLLAFVDEEPRRWARHVFPKRRGQKREDQGAGARKLQVDLWLTTSYRQDGSLDRDQAAKDYGDLKKFLDENPTGFLVHPAGGSWYASCDGPRGQVRFDESVDAVLMQVSFEETDAPSDNLFQQGSRDVPDVFSAAQSVGAQQSAYQQAVAKYFGEIADAQADVAFVQEQVQAALSQVALVTAPLDFIRSAIAAAGAVPGQVLAAMDAVQVRVDALDQDVDSLVSAANDLFGGAEVPAGAIQAAATLVGNVQDQGQAVEDALVALSPTPAGAADAVDEVELYVASCLLLFDALRDQRPPLVTSVCPRLLDVVNLAKIFYPGENAQKRSQELMALNQFPDPGAIPGGTRFVRYQS